MATASGGDPVPRWIGRLWIWLERVWWRILIACAIASVVAVKVEPRWELPIVEVLIALIALTAVILVLWQVPKWQVASAHLDGVEAAKLENDARQTLAQALGGLFVLFGLAFTWQTVLSTRQALEISERGQRAERFGKAVELLGKGRPQLSAGGIYALEQIVRERPDVYHRPVMEILTAYIREVAHWKKPGRKDQSAPADIQAAIMVIARRDTSKDNPDQVLNLRGTDLSKIFLDRLQARLTNVSFSDAHLEWAHLRGARLEKVNLGGANLEHAYLDRANLEGAYLGEGACLVAASLKDTHLEGADLRGAIGLTQEQIKSAKTDSSTQFQIPSTPAKECP